MRVVPFVKSVSINSCGGDFGMVSQILVTFIKKHLILVVKKVY
jgi:hypothetical protein